MRLSFCAEPRHGLSAVSGDGALLPAYAAPRALSAGGAAGRGVRRGGLSAGAGLAGKRPGAAGGGRADGPCGLRR